jgi:hypothetical protein
VTDHDLKELDEWSKKWLMSFNPNKTEIMLFSNTETPELNFTFNGRTIPITNSHKHLGVTAMLRDRPFNLKGEEGYCCLFRTEHFVRTTQELEYLFYLLFRERPFNLKGVGRLCFFSKKIF